MAERTRSAGGRSVDAPASLMDVTPACYNQRMTQTDLPDGLLDKVRALLAKAESTRFEAEADAFTAKAQELMAR